MKVPVLIGQFPITFDIAENLNNIKRLLDKSSKDDLVILPEGALSGYSDDISFLKHIKIEKLNLAMNQLKQEVMKRKIHIIFGSCINENFNWYNAAIGYSYENSDYIYRKVNLAMHERGIFKAGNELPVFEIKIKGQTLKLGIQLCREIRYPEQWRILALNDAQIFIYLTNAVIGKGLSVWRSHLISRAAENQRYVLASNNAHEKQHCPTMLIAPSGEIISEIISSEIKFIKETIDIGETSNWYINQSRSDIVNLGLA